MSPAAIRPAIPDLQRRMQWYALYEQSFWGKKAMFLVAALWVILAMVIALAASQRGRFGLGWLLLALGLSPLIAGILLAVLPDLYPRGLLEKPARASAVDDRALRKIEREQRHLRHV